MCAKSLPPSSSLPAATRSYVRCEYCTLLPLEGLLRFQLARVLEPRWAEELQEQQGERSAAHRLPSAHACSSLPAVPALLREGWVVGSGRAGLGWPGL